jgi:DNA-binding transcriptional MerR regulator
MQATERPYLSIGEVLELLVSEFPEITISKIRFLESRGLIDPERTSAGYRKFYDEDIERLRVILREQKENYLPLKVIRARLESGEIDDTGGITPPKGIRASVAPGSDETGELVVPAAEDVPTRHHPAAAARAAAEPPAAPATPAPVASVPPAEPPSRLAASFFAPTEREKADEAPVPPSPPVLSVVQPPIDDHDRYDVAEFLSTTGLTAAQVAELESFGVLAARGSSALYTANELAIGKACAGFLAAGIEPRHLRAWRQAADREAALFEQLVLPLLRQRNPQSRQQAASTLHDLSGLGAALRAGLLGEVLRPHLEP